MNLAIGNRQSAIGTAWMQEAFNVYRDIPGPARLAGGDGFGRGLLSVDRHLPARRVVRAKLSDSACWGIDPGEHCGGLWPQQQGRVPSVPEDRPRIAQGTRDACLVGRALGPRARGRHHTSIGVLRLTWTDAVVFDPRDRASSEL